MTLKLGEVGLKGTLNKNKWYAIKLIIWEVLTK